MRVTAAETPMTTAKMGSATREMMYVGAGIVKAQPRLLVVCKYLSELRAPGPAQFSFCGLGVGWREELDAGD